MEPRAKSCLRQGTLGRLGKVNRDGLDINTVANEADVVTYTVASSDTTSGRLK